MGDISRAYAAFTSDSSLRKDLEATLVDFVRVHDTKPYSGTLKERAQAMETILSIVERANQSEYVELCILVPALFD
jgi:hypothetical protein